MQSIWALLRSSKQSKDFAALTTAEKGTLGEKEAELHLKGKGFMIVKRNWRKGRDEIDLICLDREKIEFVEVRTRKESAVISGGSPVLVFSMEMPSASLVLRMLSSLGRIDQSKIRTGQLGDDDWPRLTSAVTLLNDKPLFIDDTPALTPGDIRSRARRVAREHGDLGMIVIDYLQLMQTATAVENRAGEISEISRSLKAMAKEFDCPVIAGSQLNRSLEQRPDKRPVMSDLRESGAIEQDSDVIIAIYRDEVYHEDAEKGIAEVIILKQRNGPIGKKKLAFAGQYTKFEDLAIGYDDFYQ